MKKIKCECPVCQDQWSLRPEIAVLSKEERQQWVLNGKIKFICEDCDHTVNWDDCPSDWFPIQ